LLSPIEDENESQMDNEEWKMSSMVAATPTEEQRSFSHVEKDAEAGTSKNNKGKNVDPHNWGNSGILEIELNPES
jgi:hypothetical protein